MERLTAQAAFDQNVVFEQYQNIFHAMQTGQISHDDAQHKMLQTSQSLQYLSASELRKLRQAIKRELFLLTYLPKMIAVAVLGLMMISVVLYQLL